MYEARQNKEKVSRRIDGGSSGMAKQSVNFPGLKEKNIQSIHKHIIQGKFLNRNPFEIISNYQNAAKSWSDAAVCVTNFCNDFEHIPENKETKNFGYLEENIFTKSFKAYTTCAGESYEPHLWNINFKKGEIVGPGAQSGVDLKTYTINSTTGRQYGEVKSSNRRDFGSLFAKVNPNIKKFAFLTNPKSQHLIGVTIDDNTNENGFYIYSRNGEYEGFLPYEKYESFIKEPDEVIPVEDEDTPTGTEYDDSAS